MLTKRKSLFYTWLSQILLLTLYQRNQQQDNNMPFEKIKCGRPVGWRKPLYKYAFDYNRQLSLLRDGNSLRHVSRLTSTSTTTLLKIKKMFL